MVSDTEQAATLAALGVKDRPYEQLAKEAAVASWRLPGQRPRYERAASEPGAPAWWTSDDEASDSFLQSMGVRL